MRSVILYCMLWISMATFGQSTGDILLRHESTAGSLYFIKPLSYKSNIGGRVEVDFTLFRHISDSLSLTINLTLEDKTLKGEPGSMRLSGDTVVTADSIGLLYLERDGRQWVSRVTSIWPVLPVADLLYHGTPDLVLYYGQQKVILSPTRKTTKRLHLAFTTIYYELKWNDR